MSALPFKIAYRSRMRPFPLRRSATQQRFVIYIIDKCEYYCFRLVRHSNPCTGKPPFFCLLAICPSYSLHFFCGFPCILPRLIWCFFCTFPFCSSRATLASFSKTVQFIRKTFFFFTRFDADTFILATLLVHSPFYCIVFVFLFAFVCAHSTL